MTIAFRKVAESYGWLGNMAPYPITHNNMRYKTTEALFQALRFDDADVIKAIIETPSPMTAKMIAKKYKNKMIIEKFSDTDIDNMQLCLRLKTEQHPNLMQALIDTGDRLIVEDTTYRKRVCKWGAKLIDGAWVGENMLGKLWMELRTELRQV